MSCRRHVPFITLVMLLACLFSTEAAEVWCRVAVGATMDADDDDGPCFACRPAGGGYTGRRDGPATDHAQSGGSRAERASVAVAARDGSVVDEPTFILPHVGGAVIPALVSRITVVTEAVVYGVEARGPPAHSARYVLPPPRAPPRA